jgi:DNA (cytosine-5)-methyltransferase 1
MLKAISLYTGVGGLDFGFEAAGFRTAVSVEMDKVCCQTVRLNRKWPILEGDVHAFPSLDILKAGSISQGEADVLIGGPPCQPFSKSSYWANGDSLRLDDPRSSTLAAFLRILRDARPRAFLVENVVGLTFKGKDEGLRHLVDGIDEVNRQAGTSYSAEWAVLNAADFGVPQLRERVFLIGCRDGRTFRFPEKTHTASDEGSLFEAPLPTYHTAWDALGDLEDDPDPSLQATGKWADLLPSIPEGQNYLYHTDRGDGLPLFGWRTRYWSFLLKLSKRLPSWTLQAQPGSATGPFHWNNRKLSARELCRLQTFPDGVRFECGRGDLQRMLGNAVPSLLAEILAREIRRQLLDSTPRKGLELIPTQREPVPKPEPAVPVPEKYRHLVGEHAAHPGTGQGPAARSRQP